MADLDAELLALAGGDSSDGESVVSPVREKSSSPVYKKEETPQPRKVTSKAIKRGSKRRKYSDDEEDDMSGSAASESASMSQSDSEAEFKADDKPVFAHERLYHSAADKADILSKPEIERESILADRNEQIEKHEQNAQLRRMLSARQKEESKQSHKNKRKASAAELDENQRKSSRQRTKVGGGRAGEADSGIAAYRKRREEQALLKEQRKSGMPERRKDPLRDDYSDADAERESDNEYDYERARDHRRDRRDDRRQRRRTSTPPRDDPAAEITDIQRVRVGRENFAQVCQTPGFEAAIRGCYVRVNLGPGRMAGVNEYRLCSIKGFQEGRPYAMEGPNKKQILVNIYIVAAHGKAERQWSFIECSNSKFTDDEWRRYRSVMANDDYRMPTQGQITKQLKQINELISHRFTDVEISMKLKAQNDLMDQVNRKAEKAAIKVKIADAEENGNDEAIRDLEYQLADLRPLKLAMNTTLATNQNTTKSHHEADRLAQLNSHNQRQMSENMQKAAMAKRRQYKKTQAPGSSQDSSKLTVPITEVSKIKDQHDDLFSGSEISRAATPVNGAGSRAGTPSRSALGNGISRSGTPLSIRGNGTEKKGLPMIKKVRRDDEVLAELDAGVDVEIEL